MNDADIKRIYNKIENKDMPFDEFRKELKALTDPVRMQQDLRAEVQKREINRVIGR